ncbi:MAG: hypothetical protein Q8O24_04200 [Gallionellaceae bacterium]|nr:hypothetical protein [Gallionellaceae bacterium]
MMNKFLLVLLSVSLSACVQMPVKENVAASGRPAWIDNPGNGVSASAGTNVYGKIKQEETAVARARTEFAKRFGVSIDAGQSVETAVSGGRASTTAQSVSVEKTNQSDVKAMVKAKWRDEEKDVIWVWLVPSN